MKVLLLADGRSAHTQRYRRELINKGVEVVLASLERSDTVDIRLEKKSVSNPLNYFFANRQIKELARKLNPDLINPHFASGYGFSTAVSGINKKYPVLLHCLGSDILISPNKSIAHRRKVIYALSRATRILTDSEYLKRAVYDLHSHEKIGVIPWGVEDKLIESYSSRVLEDYRLNVPLKVLVPRPHKKVYDNPLIILSLLELLRSSKITLTFPDWGDNFDDFRALTRSNGIENSVDYYSFMPRDKYLDFMTGFDIYLSASHSDSSPASLIEAMGAGLFPVAAEIDGIKEWLDGSNCLFFRHDTKESLSGAFKKLLNHEIEVNEILRHNHQMVKQKALFSKNIDDTIGIMKTMMHHA